MRPYPSNSPEAAGRLLALALLADGEVSAPELARLDALKAPQQIGLQRDAWHTVMRDFCADLLEARRRSWGDACRVDPLTLNQLLAEVDDPALQEKVLTLCVAVAEADQVVTDGESIVLVAAVEQWGLQARMLARPRSSEMAAVP